MNTGRISGSLSLLPPAIQQIPAVTQRIQAFLGIGQENSSAAASQSISNPQPSLTPAPLTSADTSHDEKIEVAPNAPKPVSFSQSHSSSTSNSNGSLNSAPLALNPPSFSLYPIDEKKVVKKGEMLMTLSSEQALERIRLLEQLVSVTRGMYDNLNRPSDQAYDPNSEKCRDIRANRYGLHNIFIALENEFNNQALDTTCVREGYNLCNLIRLSIFDPQSGQAKPEDVLEGYLQDLCEKAEAYCNRLTDEYYQNPQVTIIIKKPKTKSAVIAEFDSAIYQQFLNAFFAPAIHLIKTGDFNGLINLAIQFSGSFNPQPSGQIVQVTRQHLLKVLAQHHPDLPENTKQLVYNLFTQATGFVHAQAWDNLVDYVMTMQAAAYQAPPAPPKKPGGSDAKEKEVKVQGSASVGLQQNNMNARGGRQPLQILPIIHENNNNNTGNGFTRGG